MKMMRVSVPSSATCSWLLVLAMHGGLITTGWCFNAVAAIPPRHFDSAATRLFVASVARASSSNGLSSVVSLEKPMGLILEESDDDEDNNVSPPGVHIKDISTSEGSAIEASLQGNADICIGDQIVAISGQDCRHWSFGQVMDALTVASSPVQLELQRPEGTVAIKLPNGVAVAATPGEILGNVAIDASYFDIPFDCRSGACGSCEHKLVDEDGNGRYIRPCIVRVPEKPNHLRLVPTDRYV